MNALAACILERGYDPVKAAAALIALLGSLAFLLTILFNIIWYCFGYLAACFYAVVAFIMLSDLELKTSPPRGM